jgi:hypothetical protein
VMRVASCFHRFVVTVLAPWKAAEVAPFLPEFNVGNVVNGLPVAAAARLLSGCPLELHGTTSFLLQHPTIDFIFAHVSASAPA